MTLVIVPLSVFIAASAIPGAWLQLRRVQKERSSDGLSSSSVAMGASAAATWLAYGLFSGERLQIIVNSGGTVAQLLTLALLFRLTRALRGTVSFVAVYIVVMLAMGVIFGPTALGTMGTLLGFSCRVPQIVKSWREPGGSAVSVSNFALAAVSACGWIAYGVLTQDSFVLASASISMLISIYIVVRTVGVQSREVFDELPIAA